MPTRYDKEFKQNIINLYKQGESAAQMAREYGIGYSTVHKWIQGQAKTQSGKSPDEIKAMEKRLASLSEENEILRTCLVSAESDRIVENRLRSLSCQIIQAIFLERNLR
ncbi:transposase [Lacticaseibacillus paracasei]|uniref:transposase n=1 Tax=Lacticaseibacillus paracasei TaxID=1597 RepID=UPI0021D2CD3C|nr:transposase [Lacticaseibacillus paracasei]MCU6432019.1 transposase [Lacticaseibacillus paracasei]